MKSSSRLFIATTILLLTGQITTAQLIRSQSTLNDMNRMFAKQQQLASGQMQELFGVFKAPLTGDERLALKYLYAYMPLSDLADYNGNYFLQAVRMSLKARNEMPWGKLVTEDVFLHFVLPLRINNENLDTFRVAMYPQLKARIKGLNMYDAALEVNHWCHEKVTYRGSDERTSSPLASVKTSFGRCGEESTFTVTALRTVGIPARQVYTPRWAHSDDNHAWVEVWVNGKWYFLGACEPEPALNMGWFAEPARRAMLVHTRAYGHYTGTEPVIENQERFAELNLIANYAETKQIWVKVTDETAKPLAGATVEFQLYNYAEFYPIARQTTDNHGICGITTGLGDLLIWATSGGKFDYKKITVETTDTVVLQPGRPHAAFGNFDLVPPVEKTPLNLNITDDLKARNARRLHEEDSIRSAYMSTFTDSAQAVSFAGKLGISREKTVRFLTLSYGNHEEIKSFLANTPPAKLQWAIYLLDAITEKDLRDTRETILRDHLDHAFTYADNNHPEDHDFFARYVMSGRIANEMMLPWHAYLQDKFDHAFATKAQKDINVIVDWIKSNISIDAVSNMHSRSPLSPRGVYELRIADKRSRDIFFVALCRSMAIPARINPATGIPQSIQNGEWQNIVFEPAKEDLVKKGAVLFVNETPFSDPKYAINFTIARLSDGVYRSMELEYGQSITDFTNPVTVEAGDYYLVTGNRQADGSVLSSLTFFKVPENETVEVKVALRELFEARQAWGKINTADYQVEQYTDGKTIGINEICEDKGAILIWIDPDKEPSKHVLADIPAVSSVIEKWNGGLCFMLTQGKVTSSFNPATYKNLPAGCRFAYDKGGKLMQEIEKIKSRNISTNLPVIVMCDTQGNLLFYSEGYKIGVGEQLAKEINRLK